MKTSVDSSKRASGPLPASNMAAAQAIFLATLRRCGNAAVACQESGLTRRQINLMKQCDDDFAGSFDEAMDDAADLLEAEAWRRALEGVSQPLLKAGQPVLHPETGAPMMITRYSDPLLVMLLKGHKPEKFARRPGPGVLATDPSAVIREIATDDDPPRAGSV